jgi:hypothetical protein
MKARARGLSGKVGLLVGLMLLGGCVLRTAPRSGPPPVYAPPPPPPPRAGPVVIVAPPAPAPARPARVYGRPAAAQPVHVPPGQIRSHEVHQRNAERKAQHDAAKRRHHDDDDDDDDDDRRDGHGKRHWKNKGKKK